VKPLPQIDLHLRANYRFSLREALPTTGGTCNFLTENTPLIVSIFNISSKSTQPKIYSNQNLMKAFVAGATGETGRRIVQELVKRDIPVRAMVRDLAKARTILPAAVELVVGDVLDFDSITTALGDSTVMLCATGAKPSLDPTGPYQVDYEGTKNLVNAAKARNIEQFVFVSSLCVSKFFHPLNLFWGILWWKQQAEQYLQTSGLNYTIVRPGGLKNDDNPNPIVMSGADTLFDGSIPRQKVALVCVESLTDPQARNKVLEVVSAPTAVAKSWSDLFASV
jgi:uncharacterized protein YbjT (DUF2867 family)